VLSEVDASKRIPLTCYERHPAAFCLRVWRPIPTRLEPGSISIYFTGGAVKRPTHAACGNLKQSLPAVHAQSSLPPLNGVIVPRPQSHANERHHPVPRICLLHRVNETTFNPLVTAGEQSILGCAAQQTHSLKKTGSAFMIARKRLVALFRCTSDVICFVIERAVDAPLIPLSFLPVNTCVAAMEHPRFYPVKQFGTLFRRRHFGRWFADGVVHQYH